MNSNLVHTGVGGIGTGCDLDLSPFSVGGDLLSVSSGVKQVSGLTGTP
jgi:hypothetical protein